MSRMMNIWIILQKISLMPSYLWDKMWAVVWSQCNHSERCD